MPDEEIRVSPFSAMDGGFIFFVSLMGKIEKSLPPSGDGRGGVLVVYFTQIVCVNRTKVLLFLHKSILNSFEGKKIRSPSGGREGACEFMTLS